MRTIICTIIAVCTFSISGFAQQALWSGKTLISPEINSDKTVTFRLDAPKANKVELRGVFCLPLPQKWMGTTCKRPEEQN